MADYLITMDTGEKYLAHHGVKGQKWGVWNPETTARYNGDLSSGGGITQEKKDDDDKELTDEQVKELNEAYKKGDISLEELEKKMNDSIDAKLKNGKINAQEAKTAKDNLLKTLRPEAASIKQKVEKTIDTVLKRPSGKPYSEEPTNAEFINKGRKSAADKEYEETHNELGVELNDQAKESRSSRSKAVRSMAVSPFQNPFKGGSSDNGGNDNSSGETEDKGKRFKVTPWGSRR